MQEQDLYGLGKGAAQVINTSRSLQNFMILSQRRALIEQRDGQMLQEMVQGYDPNKMKGLQAKDVADYQSMYTQWKSLYLNNKDMMKNPAKYPQQFQQAEELKRRMNTLVRLSEQDKQFNEDFGIEYKKNPDKYFDGSVEVIYNNKNLPVSKQLQERGRLLDWTDVELNYKPPSTEQITKQVKQTVTGLPEGFTEFRRNVIKKGGTDGLDITENIVQDVEMFKPEAVDIAYESYAKYDGNMQKAYNQLFNRLSPAERMDYQRKVKEVTGVDMVINNGVDLGKADWMINGSMIKNAPKVEKDEAVMRQVKRNETLFDINQREQSQKRIATFNKGLQKDFELWKQENIKSPQDEALYGFTKDVVDVLKTGDVNKYMTMVAQSFRKKTNSMPTVANPKTMTLQQYKDKYYNAINKDNAYDGATNEIGVDGQESDRLREGDKANFDKILEYNYRNGRMMMYVPVNVQEGDVNKKKFIVIDPSVQGSAEKLLMIMNKGFNFSATQNPKDYGTKKKK
jgi:hypothetical protein